MARRRCARLARCWRRRSCRCWPGARSVPTTRGPRCRVPRSSVSSKAPPGAIAGRRAVVPGVRRSDAAGARPGGHRQQPRPAASRSRASKRRAPAPASRSRFSTRRSTASPATACGRRRTRRTETDRTTRTRRTRAARTASSCRGRLDLFGRLRREHEAALALVLASEQARRGVLVTLVGDVASNYFLLRELDLQLEIARQTLRAQRRDGHLFPEPSGRRRVEPARARSHPWPTGR